MENISTNAVSDEQKSELKSAVKSVVRDAKSVVHGISRIAAIVSEISDNAHATARQRFADVKAQHASSEKCRCGGGCKCGHHKCENGDVKVDTHEDARTDSEGFVDEVRDLKADVPDEVGESTDNFGM